MPSASIGKQKQWTSLSRIVTIGLACVAYYSSSFVFPLHLGRDSGSYFYYFLQLLDVHPPLPAHMVLRTPLAPLVLGVPLHFGGLPLLELSMCLMYVAFVYSALSFVRAFDGQLIFLVGPLILLNPFFHEMFHRVDSDAVFTVVFYVWMSLWSSMRLRSKKKHYVVYGIIYFLAIMARSSSIILIIFAIEPWMILRGGFKEKFARSVIFIGTSFVLMIAYCFYNQLRYNDFTISRNSIVPYYRTFLRNGSVHRDNGEASMRLADAVSNDLLKRGPYNSLGITEQQFFTQGCINCWSDTFALCDRQFGWGDKYKTLTRAGIEAVFAHPKSYIYWYFYDFEKILLWQTYSSSQFDVGSNQSNAQLLVSGHPSHSSNIDFMDVTPWPNEPERKSRITHLNSELNNMLNPIRSNNAVKHGLKFARWFLDKYPPMIYFLSISLLLLFVRFREKKIVIALLLLPLYSMSINLLGLPPYPQYRLPFDVLWLFTFSFLTLQTFRLIVRHKFKD